MTCIPHQVEVFTLSTGVWRSLYSNLPRISIEFVDSQVVVGGFHYWLAIDRSTLDGESMSCNLIISFDMTSEEFREINLPDSLARQSRKNMSVSKIRESLVVVERVVEANNQAFSVWMMEDGVLSLFTKLFTFNINTPNDASVLGFRKSGEPIIEIEEDPRTYTLVVYEPYSKRIDNLVFGEIKGSFSVYLYTETLLLLHQPNLVVYDGDKTLNFEDGLVHEHFKLPF